MVLLLDLGNDLIMNKYAKIFLLLSTIALGGKIDIGEKIPDLKIKLMDGTITSFHKLVEDGPLVVDFWATWCEPCKSIMEFHNQYHQEYFKEGFKVLMINMERKGYLEKVKNFLEKNDFQFYVATDQNNALFNRFTKKEMPTAILVAKGGEVKWVRNGYITGDEVEMKNQIEILLENSLE